MSPKELNTLMLNRLIDAAVMTVQMNNAVGMLLTVTKELLPSIDDERRLSAIKAKLEQVNIQYVASHEFAKNIMADLEKIKAML